MTTSMKWCYGLAFLFVFLAMVRVTLLPQQLPWLVGASIMPIIISLFIVFTRVMKMECRFNIHLRDEREKE